MSTDTVPQSWVDFLKEVTSQGEKAVVVSDRVSRSVRGRADLLKVLEADVLWGGELVVGPTITACKDSISGATVPSVRRVRLPERGDLPLVAQAAQAIEQIRGFASLAELDAAGLDFTALVRSALDWSGEKRSTKSVVKALAAAFQASSVVDGETVSRFSQAVEMLSFASAVGPLLEPDRLVRVVKLASETPTAYVPVVMPHTLHSLLERMVGRYSQERRERILTDLWKVSHERRWWDLKRKRQLEDPFYQRHRQGAHDPLAHQVRMLEQQRANEAAFEERLATVWKDGKLDLGPDVTTPKWWFENFTSRAPRTTMETLERLVERHGQEAFDAVMALAKKAPSMKAFGTWAMEQHFAQQDEDTLRNRNRYYLYSQYGRGNSRDWREYVGEYPILLLTLQASQSKDAKDLETLKKHHTVYFSLAPMFWEYLSDDVFGVCVESLKGAVGSHLWDTRRVALVQASEARRARAFTTLGAGTKLKVSLAVQGVCTQEQFDGLLARSPLDRRVSLMRSPFASDADLMATMEILFAQDAQGLAVLSFMSLNADKIPAGKFDEIHRGLPGSKRAILLSEMPAEMLREVLDRGVEKDDTVLAEALRLRNVKVSSLQRLEDDVSRALSADLQDVSALTSRIFSWRASEVVVSAVCYSPTLLKTIAAEDLVRFISQAENVAEVAALLQHVEASDDLDVPLEVWAAALANGVPLAGSATADVAIASGRVSTTALASLRRSSDPDDKVSVAHSPLLAPSERPANVVTELAEMLARDTADVDASEWPERPGTWADLVPQAGTKRYPMPEHIKALHGKPLEGLAGSKVVMLRSPLELHRNAEHMGNCTFGYNNEHLYGRIFIGHLTTKDGGEYNFALADARRGYYGYGHASDAKWVVREINTRFNRGGVPQDVRDAVAQVAAGLDT